MTKLLNKNTRYLLVVLTAIFAACSVLFFFLLRMQVNHLQEEQLFLKQRNVISRFKDENLDSAYSIKREFDIAQIKISRNEELNVISDTVMENPAHEESLMGHYKKLTTYLNKGNRTYRITTYISQEETTHLFLMVFAIQGFIYLILLLSIILVNRKLSALLWEPFYKTISGLKYFDLNKNEKFKPDFETGIVEFNELNQVTSELILRNQQAYQSQKQFVENASHEIQTPLAIIRSKVELMMEQPGINEQTASLALEISDATNRLSRLNKVLLLLTRIDNNQFIEQTDIDLSVLIETLLDHFHDQYVDNFPVLKKDILPFVHISANQTLIEILLSNLIKNAIVHNLPNGYLKVTLINNLMVIENSGPELDVIPEVLFERFRKGNGDVKHSYGLGLALVKHICDIYNYRIAYTYKNGIHTLDLDFG